MKKQTALFFTIILVGCATTIDQQFLSENLTRSFNASKEKCFDATLKALPILRTKAAESDKIKGTIKTERFVDTQQVSISGNSNSATGTARTGFSQLYLKVSGDSSKCTVAATKFRTWWDTKELEKIDANFVQEQVAKPLFKEVEINLSD